MELQALDLNLLLALRALLHEKNVTRAGVSVGLTQPTMSAALGRLRRHFDDELLVRNGNRYVLTPLGVALLDRVDVACTMVERVFAAQKDFDHAVSDREFTLIISDYALAVFGATLSETLRAEAPHVRLRLLQLSVAAVEDIDTTLRSIDGLVLPRGLLTGYPAVDLYNDRWLCLVADGNTTVGDQLTIEHLRGMPWAVIYDRPNVYSPVARQLGVLGIEPRIEVTVESFLAMPALVSGTDRVALIQERLAGQIPREARVRTLECPFEIAPITEALWFHPTQLQDAGHTWLRGVLRRAAGNLPPAL